MHNGAKKNMAKDQTVTSFSYVSYSIHTINHALSRNINYDQHLGILVKDINF